ncbi:MAG TPA: hypothetical protein VIJ35_22410 [Bradyrhizobium sp.]
MPPSNNEANCDNGEPFGATPDPASNGQPIGDLVPDPTFAREIGVSLVTVWRRDQAPPDGWPEKIPVGNRNFRLRRQVEFYKRFLLKRARDAREYVPLEPPLEERTTSRRGPYRK